jgi:DNA-binding transcriptional regulator PaaX
MTNPTPVVNGQLVGLAHYASRTLLERVLAPTGTTFTQSVMLRTLADHGGHLERTSLVTLVMNALKGADEQAARTAVQDLVTDKLLDSPAEDQVSLTDTGRELLEEIQAAGKEIASRLYADIPQEDLETAGRVLTLVLERANAELAVA